MTSLLALAIMMQSNQHAELKGADVVLKFLKTEFAKARTDNAPRTEVPEEYKKKQDLENRIGSFPGESKGLDPQSAAGRWLKLLDDTIMLKSSFMSVVTVIPPPESWPYIQSGIEARMAAKTSLAASTYRLFGALLGTDSKAQESALRTFWDAGLKAKKGSYGPNQIYRMVNALAVKNKYRELLRESLTRQSTSTGEMDLSDEMIELVGKDKEQFFSNLITNAKCQIDLNEGWTETENDRLIYEIAVRTAADHKSPQWRLAERMDNIKLFEAISQKYSPFSAKKSKKDPFSEYSDNHDGTIARTYYICSLAKAGQIDRAIKGAGDGSTISKLSAYELSESRNESLFEFFKRYLRVRPIEAFWDAFESIAMSNGKFNDLLDVSNEALNTKKLQNSLRLKAMVSKENALLALDKIDDAIKVLTERSKIEVKDRSTSSTDEAVYRLAILGRLLNRPSVLNLVSKLRKEEKYLGRVFFPDEVEAPAVREARYLDKKDGASYYLDETASIELIRIYSDANRPLDVIKVAEAEGLWTYAYIREVDAQMDQSLYNSRGPVISMLLASALVQVGRTEEALIIVKDYVASHPADDDGYKLLIACKSDSLLNDLDLLAKENPYEERPFIWKAKVLALSGKIDEAEQTIKAAIAIDPSDGDQGHGRRMLAYTVYAEILEKKGDTSNAKLYRSVVEAIRMSEKADVYLQAGLIARALKLYENSLTIFSDAYCIQSRLAIHLAETGRMQEAVSHYRKAYELMVDSFGYVETHCFGCESAFRGEIQQKIAEEVFTKVAKERPNKPQVHYLLGYLRETQGRNVEAVEHYRRAVILDDKYLNAWIKLGEVGKTILTEDELNSVKQKVAKLDSRPHGTPGSNFDSQIFEATFLEAYNLSALKIANDSKPLFKLKKVVEVRPRLEFGGWRRGYLTSPLPGSGIVSSSMFSGLDSLISR